MACRIKDVYIEGENEEGKYKEVVVELVDGFYPKTSIQVDNDQVVSILKYNSFAIAVYTRKKFSDDVIESTDIYEVGGTDITGPSGCSCKLTREYINQKFLDIERDVLQQEEFFKNSNNDAIEAEKINPEREYQSNKDENDDDDDDDNYNDSRYSHSHRKTGNFSYSIDFDRIGIGCLAGVLTPIILLFAIAIVFTQLLDISLPKPILCISTILLSVGLIVFLVRYYNSNKIFLRDANSFINIIVGMIIGYCCIYGLVIYLFAIGVIGQDKPDTEIQNEIQSSEKSINNDVGSQKNITSSKSKAKSTYKLGDESFKDSRDGQTYNVVSVASQFWLASNLNYKVSGSYCYDDESSNCAKYGRLYTWQAAMKACPAGWELPTNDDFSKLRQYLERTYGAPGTMMKSKSFKGVDGALDGLNSFGFNALPAGDKVGSKYQLLGENTYFWTSVSSDEKRAYDWVLTASSNDFIQGNVQYALKKNAMSVRCIYRL